MQGMKQYCENCKEVKGLHNNCPNLTAPHPKPELSKEEEKKAQYTFKAIFAPGFMKSIADRHLEPVKEEGKHTDGICQKCRPPQDEDCGWEIQKILKENKVHAFPREAFYAIKSLINKERAQARVEGIETMADRTAGMIDQARHDAFKEILQFIESVHITEELKTTDPPYVSPLEKYKRWIIGELQALSQKSHE